MKNNALAAGLKAAASKKNPERTPDAPQNPPPRPKRAKGGTGSSVMIGGQFAPEVRRTLLLVQAEQRNTGKTLKDLLGEAINDLCAKYGKPQPYTPDESSPE